MWAYMIDANRVIRIFPCALGRLLCALVEVSEKRPKTDFLNIGESHWRCLLPLGDQK